MTTLGRIRVLIAEDNCGDAELNLRELRRAGLAVEHRIVDSDQEFERELGEFAPDRPFIFVSGTLGEEYAIRALKSGAIDFVLKDNLLRLPAAVERALHDANDRSARRKAELKLAEARDQLQSIYESLPDALWSVELPSQSLLMEDASRKEFASCAPCARPGRASRWTISAPDTLPWPT